MCFVLDNELQGCLVNSIEKIKDGYKITPNKKLQIKKGTSIYRNIDIEFNKILENSRNIRKLEAEFFIYDNKISLKDEFSRTVEIQYSFEEYAKDYQKMKDNFIKSLSKTQDTPFEIKKINFKLEDEVKIGFLPVSKINELRRDIKLITFPFTQEAIKLGNIKIANSIALGVLLKTIGNFTYENIKPIFEKLLKDKPNLIEKNLEALKIGLNYVTNKELEYCSD